jgi:hypothetical protein
MEAAGVEETERRTSYLELFFDHVFVFAITQVAALMLAEPTAVGYAKSALVLGMIYWAWSGYAWATNAIDLGSPLLRLGYLAAMGASFGMAVAVPDAFGDQTLWFVIPYVVVRLLNLALYIGGLRHDRVQQRAILALAPWFALSPALALTGALLGGRLLIAFWCAGLALDVLGTLRAGEGAGGPFGSNAALRPGALIAVSSGTLYAGRAQTASEGDRTMRRRLTMILAGLAALTALALGGAAIANATGAVGDDEGQQLSSSEAERAGAAALRATGGGTVQETERDNEKGATFEVEVRKPDGSVVDVRLDSSYRVVGVDGDTESNDDKGGGEQEDAGEN